MAIEHAILEVGTADHLLTAISLAVGWATWSSSLSLKFQADMSPKLLAIHVHEVNGDADDRATRNGRLASKKLFSAAQASAGLRFACNIEGAHPMINFALDGTNCRMPFGESWRSAQARRRSRRW